MIRILANDGIDKAGKEILEKAGIAVSTDKIAQEDLVNSLAAFDGILVRSATTVRKELIDACPNLKLIGRAGVGMDNIDVAYAREKGLTVINTPEASSQSVAELVLAHLFGMVRFLHDANRNMPAADSKERFNELKKKYSAGIELQGKTIGIIGFGNIGQALARMAIGLGMEVLPYRRSGGSVQLTLAMHPSYADVHLTLPLKIATIDEVIERSDFISLHAPMPKGSPPLIGAAELARMKTGVYLVNTARGGAISESALQEALQSGKIAAAALDVFEGEPLINDAVRKNLSLSLSPHIGGSTREAQERIGIEIATKIVQHFHPQGVQAV